MISYLSPATSLTGSLWNYVFEAADTALIGSLGGLSAVLAGFDIQWDRGFFFFDPLTVSAASLHPVAADFVAGKYWANAAGFTGGVQPAMYLRNYTGTDAAIGTIISACHF